MILKLSDTKSILLLSLQITNHLLKKGFIFICLWHPILTILILNILISLSMHEALHLSFARRFNPKRTSFLKLENYVLSAMVELTQNHLKNALICLSPFVLSVMAFIIYKISSINPLLLFPWMVNSLSILPISQDMKTFLQSFNKTIMVL